MHAAGITPVLTERLELRLLKADDADAVLRFRGRQDATRYLSHEALGAEENTKRLAEQLIRAASSTVGWYHLGWAIVLRANGEVIGDARTWNTAEPPLAGKLPSDHPSLGYILHPDHQGLGYGREAAEALVAWLAHERGANTIFAGVYEPNTASRRLLESLGFTKDRHFTAEQDSHGKALPSWRYRLDVSATP
ncbi:GNAT family N-acetyltransferase [Arthrobacter sp. CJ23]|uniref:GNAT family N-acetyltransferase n=1 Tax=Arthrobacter sp. CJ23 TaxID=2972479 RepID=UPI00215BDAF1|nr:GNAT family N-acetyltransferase [Arthrobacter sp. CJ23]UVJ40100.1 GNAT family N-acetyltransferase [Arthrobacter sp. CJ23]